MLDTIDDIPRHTRAALGTALAAAQSRGRAPGATSTRAEWGAAATSVVVAVVAAAAYARDRWHRMQTWGATAAEVAEVLPGDELVGQARYRTTHAITIDAPVERVWPWLVQMGQGRGGLYSYDWLENLVGLDIHSVQEIREELQSLSLGDEVRLVPEGAQPPLRFTVVRIAAPELLVLGAGHSREEAFAAGLPYPCWTFRLTPVEPDRCRLVVRFQADFDPTPLGTLAYRGALQPVHFVMERKMLHGIKERAERAGQRPPEHDQARTRR